MWCTSFLILMLNIFCTFSQSTHEFFYFVGCFNNNTTECHYQLDNDDILYMDYEKHKIVFTVPTFVLPNPTESFDELEVYKHAMKSKMVCPLFLDILKSEEGDPPDKKDPPEITLYPSDELQAGVENSLICFVKHFYPPGIKVSWTKNGSPVTDGVLLSRYSPNNDQTFNQFSTLKFTPEEGDIYSCSVEHSALDRPQTKFWEVQVSHPSIGATIFCVVGVTLGFLGVAGGTFLMARGHIERQ